MPHPIVEQYQKGQHNFSSANLDGANLTGANLTGAYLTSANLTRANLERANLDGANLARANLNGANLTGANLTGANLTGANLADAKLTGANLANANLTGANLTGANLEGANNIPDTARLLTQITPEIGAFYGWKKAGGAIVLLQIPAEACRSNATGRKCRAAYAHVAAIYAKDGSEIPGPVTSERGGVYKLGEIIKAHEWCEDRWQECAGGIHFFLTRAEAEAW